MGNIVNFITIIMGSLLGLIIGHKFKENMKNIIMDCSGLFIIVIGIKGALDSNRDIIVLVYLIAGSIIGQLIDIDLRLEYFSVFLEKKFGTFNKNSRKTEKSFAKGFSVATTLFCTGAMAIVGAINSGLTGDNTTLNIKSVLDGTVAIILTSVYGIGVLFSSISVFLLFHPHCIDGYCQHSLISKSRAVRAPPSHQSACNGSEYYSTYQRPFQP